MTYHLVGEPKARGLGTPTACGIRALEHVIPGPLFVTCKNCLRTVEYRTLTSVDNPTGVEN